MHKIGSMIAILSGLFQILSGSLLLSDVISVTDSMFGGTSFNIYAITIIIFGAITFLFGLGSWSKPRGFSSFVLLALFGINVVVLVINGWSQTISLVSLIINIVAFITILLGFIAGNKKAK